MVNGRVRGVITLALSGTTPLFGIAAADFQSPDARIESHVPRELTAASGELVGAIGFEPTTPTMSR